jgi:nucleotide-binding universal stress UspA family protein
MAESNVMRIVVSCDASPLGAAALDAAAALARQLNAELAGLFVEDINLLRLATLPFAREYALMNAVPRAIDAGGLEQAMRRQAEAMRAALSQVAGASQVPWTFQVVRGAMLDSVLELMREPGLAVLGHAGQFVVAAETSAQHAAQRRDAGEAGGRPILVLFDGSPVAQRALQVAVALAKSHRTSLVLLIVAGDAAGAAKLRAAAGALLAGGGVQHRFQALAARDMRAVRNATQSNHAAALLWAGVHDEAERKGLTALVDEVSCPVLLMT